MSQWHRIPPLLGALTLGVAAWLLEPEPVGPDACFEWCGVDRWLATLFSGLTVVPALWLSSWLRGRAPIIWAGIVAGLAALAYGVFVGAGGQWVLGTSVVVAVAQLVIAGLRVAKARAESPGGT